MQELVDSVERVLGLALDPEQAERLLAYRDHLLARNAQFNLTGINDPEEALHKHLVDSLSPWLVPGLREAGPLWFDLGSGGGLPGIPLALTAPSQSIVLVESTQKKAAYLNEVATDFGLRERVTVLAERAEVLGQDRQWRSRGDVVVAKAVGSLAELLELGLPLLHKGGLLLALKGPKAAEEIAEAGHALAVLGGTVEAVHEYTLEWQEDRRSLVVVRKTAPTPGAYPRRAGVPKTKPLLAPAPQVSPKRGPRRPGGGPPPKAGAPKRGGRRG